MTDLTTLGLFVTAVMVLLLSPGPNMAFVMTQGATHGWRGGVACGLGIGAADLVLTALTVTGITALVAAWPPAFDLIRFGGVFYLLWLAWNALRPSASTRPGTAPIALGTVGIRALLNSLLNPKALLFFMVFLPQFVVPDRGSVTLQLLMLGVILTLVSTVFHSALGAFAGSLSRLLTPHSRFARLHAYALAAVLLLLAIRLASLSKPV